MARIAITGASGLVGRKLTVHFAAQGHEVCPLVRGVPGPGQIGWNPATGEIDAQGLNGCAAVVHLAGENIAEGRWNGAKKERIRNSRVQGTKLLCDTLAELSTPPKVLVSASAIGFYGERGDTECDERSAAGQGFLPEVCVEWERATEPASRAGIRVVNLRIGVVLSREGGALEKMLLPFQFGLGGVVGSGRQYWSWIALHDLVMAVDFAVRHDGLRGPVNAVAPQAATNREFTKVLGKVVRRPTLFPLPGFVARLVLGEMADALLLSSIRVAPRALLDAGFAFETPDLEVALRKILNRAG